MKTKHDALICLEIWAINIPSLIEYINITIIHDFLLRLHLVIKEQMGKWGRWLPYYTAFVCIFHLCICIGISSEFCARFARDKSINSTSFEVL